MNSVKTKTKKHIKIIFSAAVIIAVIIASCVVYAASLINSTKIHDGISIGSIYVGNMSKKDALKAVENHIKKCNNSEFDFQCEEIKFNIPMSLLSFKSDSDKLVEKAYNIGRDKNTIKNLKTILSCKNKGYTINFDFSFDEERLLTTVNETIQDKLSDFSPMNVEIGTDRLYVTNAVSGKIVDTHKLLSDIKNQIFELNKQHDIINIKIISTNTENPTADEFFEKYNREAKNAVYTKTEDGHKIEPEIIGIELDKSQAEKILNENKNNNQTYEIPAKITYPEITAKQLEDKYVNHIIASYTTDFSSSTANRCANIALAASKINGYVINPGKRFSYNTVVGPRTSAAGFKNAHVYVGTQVTDGIGGGICQVSSTLYNAVVLADLKIISRTNHSMPVGYTPLGKDATVAYGSIDFIFENNKTYPVSIKTSITGKQITISVVGTETPDYSVEFVTEYVKSIPYSTEKINDNTINAGETKIVSKGTNGSVVNSYRVYKRNGKEFKRVYEAKSTYSPVAEKIKIGTAVPNTQPEDIPNTSDISNTDTPTEDIENTKSDNEINTEQNNKTETQTENENSDNNNSSDI